MVENKHPGSCSLVTFSGLVGSCYGGVCKVRQRAPGACLSDCPDVNGRWLSEERVGE
jgi:hypothetical protein